MTSRAELLSWVNDLLELQYTKVEQCGTGAAYAQIMDSIYGDVPLSKIKMNANQEYEYIMNFKVLQSVFKRHGIDRPIPVTDLIKCKTQDNLGFLQWLKKYWDMHFPGGEYNAVERRKGAPAEANPLIGAKPGASALRTSTNGASGLGRSTVGTTAAKRAPAAPAARAGSRAGGGSAAQRELEALTGEMNDLKLNVEGLEKERDFYFNKLREIEIMIGARMEVQDGSVSPEEVESLKAMQAVLYSTEEGFEVPDAEVAAVVDEEETF